jgi:hypothetical protein
MTKWRAKFYRDGVGLIDTEVEAHSGEGARQQIIAKHGEGKIYNLCQAPITKSSTQNGNGLDVDGSSGLIALISIGALFFMYTPFVLMFIGGAFGAWIGKNTVERMSYDCVSRESVNTTKLLLALTLSLSLGGFGFIKGDEIKRGFDAPTGGSEQVQQSR